LTIWYFLKNLVNGSVFAWGNNGNGQLGDGTMTQRYSPVLVLNLDNVIQVSGGVGHSLALLRMEKCHSSFYFINLNHVF